MRGAAGTTPHADARGVRSRRLLALDCDGVLLDYNAAFPGVWRAAFGTELKLAVPASYHASAAYGIEFRDDAHRVAFFAAFGEEAWSKMPALPGALEACMRLSKAGYELVCVTSMPVAFQAARVRNLLELGFPIETVFAVGRPGTDNPKREVLNRLMPLAFVDDLAHNFRQVDPAVHKALVHGGEHDNPNSDEHRVMADSVHADLAGFAHVWLARDG